MDKNLQDHTHFLLNVVKLASIIIACVAAVAFFIYETQGLPPRVSKLETDLNKTTQEINSMKSELSKSSAKQDIMIDDLKLIKVHLLHK